MASGRQRGRATQLADRHSETDNNFDHFRWEKWSGRPWPLCGNKYRRDDEIRGDGRGSRGGGNQGLCAGIQAGKVTRRKGGELGAKSESQLAGNVVCSMRTDEA